MQSLDRPIRVVDATAGDRQDEAKPAFQLDAMRSVRQHRKLAVCVGLLVLVAVVGFALTRKPMYEARSLSYVEPLETKIVSDGSQGIYDPARYDSYFQQQIQTATRQDIMEAAIQKMPEGVWQEPGEDLHHAAERLAAALKVERVGASYQLAISAQADNPEKASAIVNAATNAYLEQGRKDENARSDGRLVLLQEESQRIQKELQQDRDEQAELSKTLGVADPQNSGANPYDLQLTGVRTELVAAREAHDVAAAQLASVTGRGLLSSDGLKAIADEAITSDSGFSALKASINERRAVLNAQMATLTPSSPVYKQDADEIAAMDKQVDARMTQLRQAAEHRVEDRLRLELQRTGDVEARLNGDLARATAQAGTAAPKLQRAKDLAADITRLQARYAAVDDALRGLQLESNAPGTAHLLVAAQEPDAPASNHRNLLLVLALPLAMLAGIAAAVFARKRDQRLYLAEDLEQAVGVTPMSVMPASYGFSGATMDEHLLRLAAALERGHRINGARTFVFTAASDAMNTSGLLLNLEKKLNELGFKAAVLNAADVRQSTAEERRMGKGSSKMEALKRENAFLLIDARPLLDSADTEYVVSCADATLVVAESGLTTAVELRQCMLLLQRLKATGVGTILLDAAGDEMTVRRDVSIVEPRQAELSWQRTQGFVPREMAPEPVKLTAKEPVMRPKKPIAEELPKRVQLVPATKQSSRTEAAPALREEPFMLFEEAAMGTPVVSPAKVAAEPKPVFRQEAVKPDHPVTSQYVEQPVNESADMKVERTKREALARVRARYGVPGDVTVQTNVKQETATKSTAAFSVENKDVAKPSIMRPVVSTPAVEESVDKIFEWQETPVTLNESSVPQQVLEKSVMRPVSDAPVVQNAEAQPATPVVHAQPAIGSVDLPPVRRVTISPEQTATNAMPTVQWALQPERRRVPREPIVFPRGLNKAALRMQEKGMAIAKGQTGPSLTAAEQAVAKAASSTHHDVAARPVMDRKPNAESGGRWNLLRRFGAFEAEQTEPSFAERAAG